MSLKFWEGDMSASVPIYVTRPHGRDGETGCFSQSVWMTLLVQLIVWGNAVLWGVYGLIQAVQHLF